MRRGEVTGKATLALVLMIWLVSILGGCRQERANFRVLSTPPSAWVYIDNRMVGKAPVYASLLPGTHLVETELEGYETQARWVTLDGETEARSLSVTLPPTLPDRWVLPDRCDMAWIAPNNVDVVVYCRAQGPTASETGGVWVGKVGGQEWRLLVPDEELAGAGMCSWSPDGTMLVVSGGRGPIFLFRRDEWEEPEILFEGTERSHGIPHWSPDGKYLAVENLTPDIVLGLLDLDGNVRVLLRPTDVHLPELRVRFGMAWSPDGDELAYLDPVDDRITGMQLWVMDTESAERRMLFQMEEGSFILPEWSPDSSFIALQRMQEVLILNVADGQVQRVPLRDRSFSVSDLSWSPDSRQLAAMTGRTVWVISVESGEARPVAEIEGFLLRWLGNSREILVTVWGEGENSVEVISTE